MEFQVGDCVLLMVSPWKDMIRFGKHGKLNSRYIGPFKIFVRIDPVAVKLRVPLELSNVHHVFCASILSEYLSDKTIEIHPDVTANNENLKLPGRTN